jgi:hypothetical protein
MAATYSETSKQGLGETAVGQRHHHPKDDDDAGHDHREEAGQLMRAAK